jgi:streptomycin 6-kinase
MAACRINLEQGCPVIIVPASFASATIAREGEAGRRWIAQLPQLVGALCAQWGLAPDGPPMHGYLGLVVPARRGAERCALKVSWRDESSADEALALAAWDGQGAVQLLAAQPALGALLLERLDPQRSLEGEPLAQAIDTAGRLLRRLAIPAPAGARSLQALAAELRRSLPERWERYGRPLPRRLLDRACELAAQLGPASGRLLVNHDLHYGNVLAGEREPWLAIDPKIVAGDAEFGVAQLLWRRLEEMRAQSGLAYHLQRLVEAGELDPARTRAWTLVRCVDYWLWGVGVGLTEDPARCAFIAGALE